MIVHAPYWREREKSSEAAPAALWVNLDKPRVVPFGFGVHPEPGEQAAVVERPAKKKRTKGKKP